MMDVKLIAKLGKNDYLGRSSLSHLEGVLQVDFVDSNNTSKLKCGLSGLLDKLCCWDLNPCEKSIDLLIIAATVWAADTRVLRKIYSEDRWTRQIKLYIPVSDPSAWSGMGTHLSMMLKFLTGDSWTFCFRSRPDSCRLLARIPASLAPSSPDAVALFSGGLDSLIGAIDLLSRYKTPILISHYWSGAASAAQQRVLQSMEQHYGKEAFISIRSRIGFDKQSLCTEGVEPTQRSRSFLFYAMAALAANALPTLNKVIVPENGLIALNVPLDPLRLGALSTRTTHPFFLDCMTELTSIFDQKITFENPYCFKTKGEMVRECQNIQFLSKIACRSMSCSAPEKIRRKGERPQHCGYCVPCLIRRAALSAGLPVDDKTKYWLDDLHARPLISTKAEGKDIWSFLYAAETLNTDPRKARFLVKIPGKIPASLVGEYADLYTRGMSEMTNFLQGVRLKPRII